MKKLFTLALLLGSYLIASAGDPGSGYKVGDVAIDFDLLGVDGKRVSLSNYKDAKGYIVIFTCNSCPYAVLYQDRIIEMHKKYASKGYPVIAINPNDPSMQPADSYEAMQVRAKEKNFPFPYLFDDGQEVFPVYGAQRTPHVYLLDKDRVVQYIGTIDDNPRDASEVEINYVDAAIEAVDAGKTPEITYTKAIGCGIKSKLKTKRGNKTKAKT